MRAWRRARSARRASPQALVEGAQGAGVRTAIHAASQSMWRAAASPLGDAAWRAAAAPDWRTRDRAHVGDELRGVSKRPTSPTVATNVAAETRLIPGTLISRLICGDGREAGNSRSSARSRARGSRPPAGSSRRSGARVRAARAPPTSAAGDPKTSLIGGRRLRLRPGRRGRRSWPGRERTSAPGAEQRAQGARVLVRAPHRGQVARVEQLAERAGVDPVGLTFARRSPHLRVLAITTRATCDSRIAAIPSAAPVASSATWSSGARLRANSSSSLGSVLIRPRERTSPPSIATSQKSRWMSSAIERM